MIEEEKKLLENIKYRNKSLYLSKTDVDFLLNLIGKQQKELTRQKNLKELLSK